MEMVSERYWASRFQNIGFCEMGLEKGVVMCCGFSHRDMVDPHRVDVVQVGGDVAMIT